MRFPDTKNLLNSKHMQALQSKEMSIENTINKFRIVLIFCIIIGDFIGFNVKNLETIITLSDIIIGCMLIVSVILIIIYINKHTKQGKFYGWLKYFTVFFDLLICFFISQVYSDTNVQTYMSNGDLTVIFIVLLITFNTLSILRLSRNVVLFSCALTCYYAWHIANGLGMSPIVISYVVVSILILSAINIWLSKNVLKNIIAQIDLQELNEEILTQKEELELKNNLHINSMSYARRIQQALLPSHEKISLQIPEYFVLYKPKDIVSGDFFWFKDFENYWIFAAADCTGHGVPGAFMSVMGISFLNEIIQDKEFQSPSTVLDTLREKVKMSFLNASDKQRIIKDGMDIALCIFNKKNNEIHFSGAYNPLLIVRNNAVIELKPDRQPVGSHVKEKPFSSERIKTKNGDCIYMYSDGFADQIGGAHKKKYLSKNLRGFISKNHGNSFKIQKKLLESEFNDWRSSNIQIDDVLIVGLKIGLN